MLIDEIIFDDKEVEIDQEKVESLAESIKQVGLINPITVTKDGHIVAGRHRLAACKLLGMTDVPVTIIDKSELETELVEIDENLIRKELHYLEKAELLARRKEIYEQLYPETKQGVAGAIAKYKKEKSDIFSKNGNSTEICNSATAPGAVAEHNDNNKVLPSFASDTARKTGLSERVVFEDIQLAKKLTPIAKQVVRNFKIDKKQALKLASMPEEEQEKVIEKIKDNEAKDVKKAIVAIKKENEIEKIEQKKESGELQPPIISLESFETWLPKQPQCDLLITDPPYSTDIEDIESFVKSWLPLALSKVKPTGRAYIFIGAYPKEIAAYLNCAMPTQICVWEYKNTIGPTPKFNYIQNWQAILYYKGVDAPAWKNEQIVDLLAVQNVNAPDGRTGVRWHAWEKPMELANKIISQASDVGDIVLDPFAGTGTFLLSAQKLGRIAKGCDISQEMLEIAKKRGCQIESEIEPMDD